MDNVNNIQAATATKQKSLSASNALQHRTQQSSPSNFSQTLQNALQAKNPSAVESKMKNEAFEFKIDSPTVTINNTQTANDDTANKSDAKEEYSQVKYAVEMGLYNYMLEQKEEELRAKAGQQVLEEQGLTKESMAALPKEKQDDINQQIEDRYQELRKNMIEEMINQLKLQLQNALQNSPDQEPTAPPQGMLFIPPA
jgi:hypothetical protein